MSWFYLALLAPFLYAVVNLIDDNLIRAIDKGPGLIAMIAGLFGALPLISLLFLDVHGIPGKFAIMSVIAGFLTITYYYFYFKALEVEQPSVVVALFSLVPATLPFLAFFFLGERLTALQILGFIVVLGASFTLAVTDIKKFKFSDAIWFIVVAAALLDITSLLSKYVYQNVDFYSAYMFFSAGMGLGGIAMLIISRSNSEGLAALKSLKSHLKKILPFIVIGELFNLSAEFTLNLAVSKGPVSLVRVIEGIQPIFVLLIALALFPFAPRYFREAGEGHLKKKFIGMVVIVIGLGLISMASSS